MKHNRRCRKLIAILLCICLMVPMISGCGEKKEEETKQTSSGTLVFQYGNNLVTKGEVYIYIETVRERYEMQYGSDVWQTVLPDGGAGTSMENLTREEVVNEIVRVKTLCAHAEELGITLGDDELAELNQKADDFCEGLTDEQLQNMEITKEKAEKVMQENAIASKVEAKILDDRKIEISDEEARMTTFYDMYFACYSMDENGVITPYTDDQKKQQYENALQACSTLATADLKDNTGAAIEKLAEYYQLDQAQTQTMSPSQILETYGQDVYDLLFWTMEKGIRECFEGGEIPLERPMEVVRTIFTFFKENERAVRHAYDPINRIQYETLIKQNIEPMVRLLFLSCERAQELPEDDLSFLVSFYTYSLGGFFIRWIEEGMPDEFHAQLDKFFILMNNSIPLLIDKFLNP